MLTMTSLNPPRSLGEKSLTSKRQRCGFAIFAIHLVEIAGEEAGFFAAGAGADFQEERIDGVVLGGDEFVLEGFEQFGGALARRGEFGGGELGHFGVGGVGGHFLRVRR